MALTKVTGGILSQPIDLGITTATTGFFSGIVTAQSVRVLGDLTVDGSTTTLDTVVTEVDRLEIGANNTTVGVAITQSGTGNALTIDDGNTRVFTVKDGGSVRIGDNASYTPATGAEDLVVGALTGNNNGITIITGSGNQTGSLSFADSASGNPGALFYRHTDNTMLFRVAGGTRMSIKGASGGRVGIGTTNPTQSLHIYNTSPIIQFTDPDNGLGSRINADNGNLYFDTHNQNRDVVFRGGNSSTDEVARITGDGLVGIGTGAPTVPLQINHVSPKIILEDNDNGADVSIANIGGAAVYSSQSDVLFQTADTSEKLRITSNGNVGINSTSPATKLDVRLGAAWIYPDDDGTEAVALKLGKLKDFNSSLNDILVADNDGSTTPTYRVTNKINRYIANWHFDRVTSPGATRINAFQFRSSIDGTSLGNRFIIRDRHDTIDSVKLWSEGDSFIGVSTEGATINLGIGTDDPQVQLNVVNPTSLGGTVSNRQEILRLEGNVANDGMLEFANVRISNGSDWETSAFRIQRRIDSTRMGYIDFGTGAGSGAGGAGRDIQFGTGDGTIMMHLDSAGRVGIGTGNPVEVLHVHQSGTTAAEFRLENSEGYILLRSDNNLATYDAQQHIFRSRNGNSEYGKFDSDGNFGIGTNSPVARLHIHNSGTTAADHAYAFFTTGDTGSSTSDGLTVGVAANQVASINYREAGKLTLNTSSTPRITILSDGKVGIRTENPDHRLHLYKEGGDAVISIESTGNGNHSALEFYRTSSGGDSKGAGSIYVTGDTSTSEAKMQFGVGHNISHGAHPRMTIMGNGEVGIGTDNPTQPLTIARSSAGQGEFGLRFQYTNTTGPTQTSSALLVGSYGLKLKNYNSSRNFLFETGNVGIGTDNPVRPLHIENSDCRIRLTDVGHTTDVELSNVSGDAVLTTNGASNLRLQTNNTERIRIQSTGQVGIGTVSPNDARLRVVHDGLNKVIQQWGGAQGSSAGQRFMELYSPATDNASDYFRFQTGNAFKFRIDNTDALAMNSSADIGIGTDAPLHKLDVYGDINFQNNMLISNAEVGNANNIDHIWHSDASNYGTPGTWNFVSDQSAKATGNSAIQIGFLKSSGGGHLLGNVGIGTTNPSSLLHVDGDVTIKDASPAIFFIDDAGVPQTPDYRIQVNTGNFVINDDTNSATRLLIDSSGNVGIGTTNPSYNLDIHEGSADDAQIRIRNNKTGNTQHTIIRQSIGGTNASNYIYFGDANDSNSGQIRYQHSNDSLQVTVNTEERLRIDSDGNVGIGTDSPDALIHLHKSSTSGFDGILMTNSTTGVTTSGGFTIGLNDFEEGRIWHYGNESIQFGVDNELHGTLRQDGRWCLGPNQTSGSRVLNVFAATGPSAQFHSNSDAGISIQDNSDDSAVEITNNNGQLTIDLDHSGQVTTEAFIIEKNGGSSGTAELFRINSDGNVGIGTDNPSYLLHTFNGGAVGSDENDRKYNGRFTTYTPNRLNLDIYDRRWQDTQTHGWLGTEKRIEYNVDNNASKRMWMSFFNANSTTASNVIRFGEQEDTEWMRIFDGKVGIGSENPQTQLDVVGDDGLMVRTKTNGGASGSGGAVIKMTDQTPTDDQAGFIKYRHTDTQSPGNNYGSAFFVTSETSTNAFVIGDFEHDNPGHNNDLLVKRNVGIGTEAIARGPLHVHQRSNDDVQIHMSNNETGSTSTGRGFTIFGGAGTNGRDMGFVNRESNGAIEFYTNNNGTLTQRGAWVASDNITTFAINTGTNGNHSNIVISNHDTTDYNGTANRTEYPMLSDIHFTGSDAISGGNKTHAAWRNDVEMTITNNTSNSSGSRLQVYGIHSTLNATKYAYILYGAYLFCNSSANNAVNTQSLIGAYGYAQGYINASSSNQAANIYGGHFIGYRGGDTTGGHCYGLLGRAQQTTNGAGTKTGDMTGVLGEVEVDEGTISSAYSFRAIVDMDDNSGSGHAGSVLTTGYLYYGSYSVGSGTTVTNRRGIWLTGSTDNYLAGDLEITGTFEKGTDNFRIPHPLVGLTTTKDLVHSVIEGPQMDLIYRGKTDLVAGISTINIDTKAGMTEGTFVALCKDIQCFTSNETGWTNVKGSVTGNQLTIIAQDNTCTDTISWMVVGERQDDNAKSATCTDDNGNLIVEPDKKPAKDAVKYECEDNIHNADPNHNPKDD